MTNYIILATATFVLGAICGALVAGWRQFDVDEWRDGYRRGREAVLMLWTIVAVFLSGVKP